MRRAVILVLFGLTTGSVALATGFGGDNPPARIPVPAKDFSATFEDAKGTVVEAKRVTYNGEVFLYGTVGQGQVTIPFEKLKTVEFVDHPAEEKRLARVSLKDGSTVEVIVDDDVMVYGETTYGNYAITTADLRRLTLR